MFHTNKVRSGSIRHSHGGNAVPVHKRAKSNVGKVPADRTGYDAQICDCLREGLLFDRHVSHILQNDRLNATFCQDPCLFQRLLRNCVDSFAAIALGSGQRPCLNHANNSSLYHLDFSISL